MMLDSQAEVLHRAELPEIQERLPAFAGLKVTCLFDGFVLTMQVLELGAGIGRFTSMLADEAASVTAVEFMESFVDVNRSTNGSRPNISFVCADVTTLDFPDQSFDLIFSNWLMMYLTDSEVAELAAKTLRWLTPHGHMFFRESCRMQVMLIHSHRSHLTSQSGNLKRGFNPTKYREAEHYSAVFEQQRIHADIGSHSFTLVHSGPIQAYATLKVHL
jgi:phosphoethanolamine N-methyltransferase